MSRRSGTQKAKRFFRPIRGKRFIITAAQNATPVHPECFATLKKMAKHLRAELIVIPLRYKNPTSRWSRKQDNEEWWAEEVTKYLHNVRKKLGEHLVLAADVKTQPTASSPLSGFEALTRAESCIIGHPKMQFRTVPVSPGKYPKILTTTGVCTVPNYTDTKAGKIGAFHHFLGGLVVTVRGKKFHMRQLNFDEKSGTIIDLDLKYSQNRVSKAPPAEALIMGDTHVRVLDPDVDRATFGPGGIVETLNPKKLIFHDIKDGETTNPHDIGNPFISEAKRRAHRTDVRAEIQEVVDFVNARAKGRDAIIVDSNHHDFLSRWIIRTDWRQDLKNAAFYLDTAKMMLESARMEPGGATYDNPFTYWLSKLGCTSNIRCLEPDESFEICGIECSLHGHQGPGGARGSLKNLSRLGVKVVVAHSHRPGIEEGGYQVGTSSYRRLAYQRGPDGCLNTDCAVYANGKRALITVIGDEWR